MLYRNLLTDALQQRRADFVNFEQKWRAELREYTERLGSLATTTSVEIADQLRGVSDAGALPGGELDQFKSFVRGFKSDWRSHEEARRWAIAALRDRTTFATDGSQLLLQREISMRLAVLQIATFENDHTESGTYIKAAQMHVLTAADLLDDDGTPESVVSRARTTHELAAIQAFMERKRGWQERAEAMPVAFFDGSLSYLLSFAQLRTNIEQEYTDAVVELLRLSCATAIPVVGFVDQSYARDIVKLLDSLDQRTDAGRRFPYDAQLLAAHNGDQNLLPAWGDRTIFCYWAPERNNARGYDAAGRSVMGFSYLRTSADHAPARVELPAWVSEARMLEEVFDVVRAECVSGLGYPYALETADAAAVINVRDREQILAELQVFAEREGIGFQISRKATSKVRRR